MTHSVLNGFVPSEADDERNRPGLDPFEGEVAMLVRIGVEHVELDGHHSSRLDLPHEVTGGRIVLEVDRPFPGLEGEHAGNGNAPDRGRIRLVDRVMSELGQVSVDGLP
jgi:hypothetical protein